jgi:hypothetical protein
MATFWGRKPSAPAAAPVAIPTPSGPERGTRPIAHPSGAASAVVLAMRCHSGGISLGRWRARAIASDVPSATAPAIAATAAFLTPR